MKILGIDPALTCLGWGIIESVPPKIKYIESGLIKTKSDQPVWCRLSHMVSAIESIIDLNQPDAVAMEDTFLNNNPSSSLKLAYVRGAVMALIGQKKLPYFEFLPNKIKKTIVGVGHADKNQVKHMVQIIISETKNNISFDESDALAIAYTGLVAGCN